MLNKTAINIVSTLKKKGAKTFALKSVNRSKNVDEMFQKPFYQPKNNFIIFTTNL